MCKILKEVYRKVYDDTFEFDLNKRILLQKEVYLLENLGINVGEYSFRWDKYGPYSLKLDSDAKIYAHRQGNSDINFTQAAEDAFAEIRKYLAMQVDYSKMQWIECIASLHYLKYVMNISDENLFSELKEKKAYLNKKPEFKMAFNIIKNIEER